MAYKPNCLLISDHTLHLFQISMGEMINLENVKWFYVFKRYYLLRFFHFIGWGFPDTCSMGLPLENPKQWNVKPPQLYILTLLIIYSPDFFWIAIFKEPSYQVHNCRKWLENDYIALPVLSKSKNVKVF